ncbi:MAG: hypothetical protein E6Q97_12345 [Desulfurellales bacterium]|nr:MAG: hypothetical protein E6Q97_12345 [Desulfurellales bacterium]
MSREIRDIHGTVYGQVTSATNAEDRIVGVVIRLNAHKAEEMAEALLDSLWTECNALGAAIMAELGKPIPEEQ